MKTISMEDAKRLVAEGTAMPREQRLAVQQQRLRELVAYVREHSPYLAARYAGLPEDFSLTDLPVITKQDIVENYDDYVTDRRLKKSDVLEYVNRDPSKDMSLLLGEYTALRTSGSTGEPLPMVRDDYHNKIHGQMMAQRLLTGVDKEVLNLDRHRRASVIHMSNGASSYGALNRNKAAHPDHQDNILGISVLESIDHIVEILNEFQPETMAGYPSVMVQLAVEQQKGNLKLNLKHLGTSAEMLTEANFWLLRDAFKCPIANNYCMTEGGEVAMTHDCPHLHINEDWVIVEPVDKDMRPLGESDEWSTGVLITELSNFVQPIIRYYVTDVIRVKSSAHSCSDLPCMEIQGRTFGNATICGKTFSVVGLFGKAEVWPGVVKFQFVQTAPDTLQVRGLCTAGSDAEEVLGSLAVQLKAYLAEKGCTDAKVTWSTETFIPNARGGKIPIFVKL